ncbi:MAG TPA: hypothetical protein VJ874_07090 [Candidatus Thermoplasmatota archaeon]|nr:hypothetical protein [Candidatus Thermoplasmatota archaeon]
MPMSTKAARGVPRRVRVEAVLVACGAGLALLSGCTVQGQVSPAIDVALLNDSDVPLEGVQVEVIDGSGAAAILVVDRIEPFATAHLTLGSMMTDGTSVSVMAGGEENGLLLKTPCPGGPRAHATIGSFSGHFSGVALIRLDTNCQGTWSP